MFCIYNVYDIIIPLLERYTYQTYLSVLMLFSVKRVMLNEVCKLLWRIKFDLLRKSWQELELAWLFLSNLERTYCITVLESGEMIFWLLLHKYLSYCILQNVFHLDRMGRISQFPNPFAPVFQMNLGRRIINVTWLIINYSGKYL